MTENLPAKITKPLDKELISEIAMDIGKSVAQYIDWMYPKAVEAASSSFLLAVRNSIHNEIMAAIELNDEGQIIDRLKDRKKWRRGFNKLRKITKEASPENAAETLAKMDKWEKEYGHDPRT
jgi:hypothetical protein